MTQPPPLPAEETTVDEQQSLRDRLNDRKVLAAIAVAALVVVGLGLFVVKPLLSGSSSNDSGAVVTHHHVVTPTASASATPSTPAAAATPAPQLKVRDPFSPLVVPVTAAVSPSPTAAQPSTPTIVVVQPSESPASATYSLTLNKLVDAKTVQVTLNGKQQTVAIGQNFPDAQNGPFQLTYVSPAADAANSSAQFAYGDENFSLATGETKTES